MKKEILATLMVGLSGLIATEALATPVTFDGIEFPGGEASFADALVDFNVGTPSPTSPTAMDPLTALGTPDDVFFSLGVGGSITLQFTDNALTGSGDGGLDLFVFEIGSSGGGITENLFVELSTDGSDFIDVGTIMGDTTGLDIDPALSLSGLDPFTQFLFIRLTDDPNQGGGGGLSTIGADIDAVAAISSSPIDPLDPPAEVPLPAAAWLFIAGISGLGASAHRKKTLLKAKLQA